MTTPSARRQKYVCTVQYCPHHPPRYTPKPGRKCHAVYRCMNIHVTDEV